MKRIFYLILISLLFIPQTVFATESAEVIYAKAYGNIYKNNPKEAIRIFERGISSYPDCAFLYAGMGDAYLKEGNINKAIDAYTNAQRKKYTKDNYKLDFYNAKLIQTMNNINFATNKLIAATKISDNPLLYKNIRYLLNEDYIKTIYITEDYFNENDEELKAMNTVRVAGKKEEALRGYLKILNQNPKNYQAANNAGVLLIELKDYQLAEKYLIKALELNPSSALILNNLGIVKSHLCKYGEMEESFNNALKLKSDYVPAINNQMVGSIHKNISFYKTTNVNTILDIAKKDNGNYYALRILAKIYFLKGDYKSALNIILPLNSNYNFKIYTHKAYTAYKAGEYQTALNYINNAISLYSDNAVDYEIRGRIYSAMAQYPEARTNFQKAMQKNRKSSMPYYYSAVSYEKEGNRNAALSNLKTFLALKKGNPQSSQITLLLN